VKNIIWVFRTFGFGAGILYTVDVCTRIFRKPWNRRAEDRTKTLQPSSIEAWLSQEEETLEDEDVEEIQVHNFNTLN
jgi:hypothetical protein